jgi:flagellar biosynthesis/type III secretory pathway protein FliH
MLPEEMERELWQELKAFEEKRKVTYVTNAEKFGFERGIQEGLEQGLEQGLERERSLLARQLTRKLGGIPPALMTQIQELSISNLESLGDALLDFTQLSDLENWLRSH